jgi:hypothetical protein
MVYYIVMKAKEGSFKVDKVPGKEPSLEVLKKEVGESVHFETMTHENYVLCIDEEGAYKKDVSMNINASALVCRWYSTLRYNIVGDCVLVLPSKIKTDEQARIEAKRLWIFVLGIDEQIEEIEEAIKEDGEQEEFTQRIKELNAEADEMFAAKVKFVF